MPSAMPKRLFTWGLTYTGTAPASTMELIMLRCTFLGRISFSPCRTLVRIMACTAEVVPLTMKKAAEARNAWAANSSASRMTETGCTRLSTGFMEFTSMETHFSPSNATSSGCPLPRLWPGTSKGTTRFF